jgi:hypothetical protein
MTTADTIRGLVGQLREGRRANNQGIKEERLLLEQIGELVEKLEEEDEDQWEIINNEGWRGWPDLYDAHMAKLMQDGKIVENVDPDDPAMAGKPPRKVKE